MSIFNLIAHMSLLIHCGHDVEGIVENISGHKEKFPSAAEFVALIDDVLGLLTSGMLTLPDDVIKKMVDSLTLLKSGLALPAGQAS